ncbi:MAG TPA: metalloregulator ArsR/SmtB family transcription factor [Egibacteraceae bacterium]|jgi:rhodanese-related sulfurtransferase/DNA-binding transcriptional ArsR family regulator|nr:metalloregulator ArsR/SmtB family transcription factor [Egibacteraceae bacterium]
MSNRQLKDALYGQLARAAKALANGKRLEVLELLAQGERRVEAIARATAMSVTNTSAHLQVLRQGGLVAARKDGTRVYYRLAGDDVARFVIALRDLARSRLGDVDRAARAYLDTPDDEQGPVSREELWERIQRGGTVVVDVRPAEEYAAGHIPGAVSVPVDELEARLAELPEDTEIVAYCRGPFCVYAPQAVSVLRRHGRTARQLEDGFPEWRLDARPVETARSPAASL